METKKDMTIRKSEQLKQSEVEFLHAMERVQTQLRRRADKKKLVK